MFPSVYAYTCLRLCHSPSANCPQTPRCRISRAVKPMTTVAPESLRVPILGNPRAGSGKSRRIIEELVTALRGKGLISHVCWQLEELNALLTSSISNDIRCVVAAGGDGTLLEVINRAPGIPTTVLPLGNENLVARHCGLGRSGRTLAEVIADGCVRRYDLARVNGRLFCLMASVGLDADVVHRVHCRRRGHINRLTYAIPLLQAMQNYHFPQVDIEIDDTGERLRGATVFVFNLPEYALGLPIVPKKEIVAVSSMTSSPFSAVGNSATDGLLDLCVFERPGVLELVRYLAAAVMGKHRELPDFQYRKVRRVRLSSSEAAPIQTDGDPAGRLPATIEVIPGALPLVVPIRES